MLHVTNYWKLWKEENHITRINKGFCVQKVIEVTQPVDDSGTMKVEQMTVSLA